MPTTSRTFAMSTTTIGAIVLRDRPPGALIVVNGWLSSCAYCGRVLNEENRTSLVFDHVIPRGHPECCSRPENVVVACQACNIQKGDASVIEAFPHALPEVMRRTAIYVGRRGGPRAQELRRVGRELGDHLYPWAAEYRAAEAERSLARWRSRRAAALSAGLGGTAFPFGELQEKGCNLREMV